MKNLLALVIFVLLISIQTAKASPTCELFFHVLGEPHRYSYLELPDFVREKIRGNVKATTDEHDRYDVVISSDCESQPQQNHSATLTFQRNTIYIKELNNVPLCKESMTPDGLRCERNGYNYVDYKGGADLSIDESSAIEALNKISSVSTVADMESANQAPEDEAKIHNAIRLFAMLLAESARFDYVLNDIECATKNKASIKFMDYWTLVHNWGSITARVTKYSPILIRKDSKSGIGSLFVPVTPEMVNFFNEDIKKNPPPLKDITKDGKNIEVPVRTPSCDLLGGSNISAQKERDEILSLLAMAIVGKDWQTDVNGRGHNIGSILVDKSNKPVFWARNSIKKRDDATQHGEVRLMQGFLKCPSIGKYANGYSVYTTLEPCAMCSGMLAMTQVDRVIYLQRDPAYGGIGAALKNSKYPRAYEEYTPNQLTQKIELEREFDVFQKKNNSITDFLLTDEAHRIFMSAGSALSEYQTSYPENDHLLDSARAYLSKIAEEKYDEQAMVNCPAYNTLHEN